MKHVIHKVSSFTTASTCLPEYFNENSNKNKREVEDDADNISSVLKSADYI